METKQKNNIALTVQINEDLKKDLVEYCAVNGLKIGPYVEKCLRDKIYGKT